MELKATKYAVGEQIATITLSRPHRLNAWTGRMHTEYRHLLACADADPEVRVVVVTGGVVVVVLGTRVVVVDDGAVAVIFRGEPLVITRARTRAATSRMAAVALVKP